MATIEMEFIKKVIPEKTFENILLFHGDAYTHKSQNNLPIDDNKNNQKRTFESKVFRYLPLITTDMFNHTKLVIKEKNNKNSGNILKTILPVYNYNSRNEEIMVLQLPFIDVDTKNILYFRKTKPEYSKKKFEIRFIPQFFGDKFIDILIEYENKVFEYVKSVYGNDMTYKSRIVHNKNSQDLVNRLSDLDSIKCKIFPDKKFQQYGKLINYNISKKYDAMEEFDLFNMTHTDLVTIFDRILNNKKQLRLLVTPITYVNINNRQYMSNLKIIMMEVRYKDAKISSPLEANKIDIKPEITKITI